MKPEPVLVTDKFNIRPIFFHRYLEDAADFLPQPVRLYAVQLRDRNSKDHFIIKLDARNYYVAFVTTAVTDLLDTSFNWDAHRFLLECARLTTNLWLKLLGFTWYLPWPDTAKMPHYGL